MIDQQTDVGFEAIQNWFFEKYIPTSLFSVCRAAVA